MRVDEYGTPTWPVLEAHVIFNGDGCARKGKSTPIEEFAVNVIEATSVMEKGVAVGGGPETGGSTERLCAEGAERSYRYADSKLKNAIVELGCICRAAVTGDVATVFADVENRGMLASASDAYASRTKMKRSTIATLEMTIIFLPVTGPAFVDGFIRIRLKCESAYTAIGLPRT